MPPNDSTPEINANAGGGVGSVPTTVTLTPASARLRLNASPTRTFTVSVIGPGTVRHATVDNAGTNGAWADAAAGSSFTVSSANGSREVVLVSAHESSVVRCVAA